MDDPRTAPPFSQKNSGKSVPPPKKLTRKGVCTIITLYPAEIDYKMFLSGEPLNCLEY